MTLFSGSCDIPKGRVIVLLASVVSLLFALQPINAQKGKGFEATAAKVEVSPVLQHERSSKFFSAVNPVDFQEKRGILSPQRVKNLHFATLAEKRRAEQAWGSSFGGAFTALTPGASEWGAAVTIDDQQLFSTNGKFILKIPGIDKEYVVQRNNFEYNNPDEYTYFGRVIQDAEDIGYMTVVKHQGDFGGNIVLDSSSYRISPLAPGVAALTQQIYKPSPNAHRCTPYKYPKTPELKTNANKTYSVAKNTPNEVRVLVMFTQRADDVWDPYISAQASMAETNQALSNSNISYNQLHFVLVAVELFPSFVERAAFWQEDLDNMRDDDFIDGRRTANQADIVVVLTDGNYKNGDLEGLAYYEPNSIDAYAFVEVQAPGERQTFSHEVAHLFGCQHQITSDQEISGYANTAFYARGSTWKKNFWSTRKYSIVSNQNNKNELLYSNPEVYNDTQQTGEYQRRNNAQQL